MSQILLSIVNITENETSSLVWESDIFKMNKYVNETISGTSNCYEGNKTQ